MSDYIQVPAPFEMTGSGSVVVADVSEAALGADNTKTMTAAATAAAMASYTFIAEATIAAGADVATPVEILADDLVPTGKKVYIAGWRAYVNGATQWTAGTGGTVFANLKIQDTNGTPVDFATIALAALTANAVIFPHTSNVTNAAAFLVNSGGTAAKGLQIVGNSAATTPGVGSDLVVTVWGYIK